MYFELSVELNTPVYHTDYLDWPEPANERASAEFFVDTAERIDIDLRDVSFSELYEAMQTSGSKGSVELTQIARAHREENVGKTFWHFPRGAGREYVETILGGRVPLERIIEM
jgi:hypothetical protein